MSSDGASRRNPDRPRAQHPRRQPLADSPRLPPPLLTSEKGSFARHTIMVRGPQIIDRLARENGYPPGILADLAEVRRELGGEEMGLLQEDAPDTHEWNALIRAERLRAWLNARWYIAEAYFYRRILEAVRYFQPGRWQGLDPFGGQKAQEQASAVDRFQPLPAGMAQHDPYQAFAALLHSSLWGNRADLSNTSPRPDAPSGTRALRERRHIIVDHTTRVLSLLRRGVERIDFVCDNVGMDILADLVLGLFLLESRWTDIVVLHLKDRPFFVSDAMATDVVALLGMLQRSDRPGASGLGDHLATQLRLGRLSLREDAFWSSGWMYRDLPEHLAAVLAASDLVILKGDVNYRRLLDDRHWPFTTSLDACAGYFPSRFVALRTLKGEILAGLAPGQADVYASGDASWLTRGRLGVVQMGGAAEQASIDGESAGMESNAGATPRGEEP